MDWVRLSSAIERNRTHRKEKKSIEPNRTFDFRTRDLCKTDVENPLPDLRSSSYFSPECSARVFRKRRNSAEMASNALWIVSLKCIVKGKMTHVTIMGLSPLLVRIHWIYTQRNYARHQRIQSALSMFFHKNNASSSSSGTFFRALGKITLDTQELNLHEHLVIYFDFDLKRKIILLLHLLFLLSIMAVRCSQKSNILTLVHLYFS